MYRLFQRNVIAASVLVVATSANAGIVSWNGAVNIIAPPPNVSTGSLESNSIVWGFAERQNVTLSQSLTVDVSVAGTSPEGPDQNLSIKAIEAGTVVSSYFFHYDIVGTPSDAQLASGSITFDSHIVGIIFGSARLNSSHALVGLDGVAYPEGEHQGIEVNDAGGYITLSDDYRTVDFSLRVVDFADNFRVLTAVPEASSLVILVTSACGILIGRRYGTRKRV